MNIKAELDRIQGELMSKAFGVPPNTKVKNDIHRLAADLAKLARSIPPDAVVVPEFPSTDQIDAGIKALDGAGVHGNWREVRAIFGAVYYAVTHDEKGQRRAFLDSSRSLQAAEENSDDRGQ